MALNNNGLKRLLKMIFYMLIIFMMYGLVSSAAEITLEPGESIQAAIDKASSGDIIEVKSGTYKECIELDKTLTLSGIDTGKGHPVIDADGGDYAITLNADGCAIEGLKIINLKGAGIRILSNSNNISNNIMETYSACVFLKNFHNNTIYNNSCTVLRSVSNMLMLEYTVFQS